MDFLKFNNMFFLIFFNYVIKKIDNYIIKFNYIKKNTLLNPQIRAPKVTSSNSQIELLTLQSLLT